MFSMQTIFGKRPRVRDTPFASPGRGTVGFTRTSTTPTQAFSMRLVTCSLSGEALP